MINLITISFSLFLLILPFQNCGEGFQANQIENIETFSLSDNKFRLSLVSNEESFGSIKNDICKSPCENRLEEGSQVTITAEPKKGYEFQRWVGACDKQLTQPTCVFEINENMRVQALFIPEQIIEPVIKVNISLRSVGVGTIGWSGCTSPCVKAVDLGTLVELEAIPEMGYQFAGWQATVCKQPTASTCVFTTSTDIIITANFEPIKVDIEKFRVSIGQSTGGVIKSSACNAPCQVQVEKGQLIKFEALPGGDYTFDGWNMSCTTTAANGVCFVKVTNDINISAKFKKNPDMSTCIGNTASRSLPSLKVFSKDVSLANIKVKRGQKLSVAARSENNKLIPINIRIQQFPFPNNFYQEIIYYVGPSFNGGVGADGHYKSPQQFRANKTSCFDFDTLTLLPGKYRLVTHLSDEDGKFVRIAGDGYIYSNTFEITPEISDKILPSNSTAQSVNSLTTKIKNTLLSNSSLRFGLFNMSGDLLTKNRSVKPGEMLVFALNSSKTRTFTNNIEINIKPNTGASFLSWLQIYPGSRYGKVDAIIDTANFKGEDSSVLLQYFHLPTHQYSENLTGELQVVMKHSGNSLVAASTTLIDTPKKILPSNPSSTPLQTFKVRFVLSDPYYSQSYYRKLLKDELQSYFKSATKGYFAMDVTIHHYSLDSLGLDYKDWWNKLSNKDVSRPMNIQNSEDSKLIQAIYTYEKKFDVIKKMKVVQPISRNDVVVYAPISKTGGGASQNNYEVQMGIKLIKFVDNYLKDGKYGRPAIYTDRLFKLYTDSNSKLVKNIAIHELGHTLWRGTKDVFVDHMNGYGINEQKYPRDSHLDGRVLTYLLDRPSRKQFAWGRSVMSYARDYYSLENKFADEQLSYLIKRY